MGDERIYIKINSVDASEIRVGDKVKCIHSRIDGRTNKEWIVRGGWGKTTDEKICLEVLRLWASYGDVFEKLIQ